MISVFFCFCSHDMVNSSMRCSLSVNFSLISSFESENPFILRICFKRSTSSRSSRIICNRMLKRMVTNKQYRYMFVDVNRLVKEHWCWWCWSTLAKDNETSVNTSNPSKKLAWVINMWIKCKKKQVSLLCMVNDIVKIQRFSQHFLKTKWNNSTCMSKHDK